MLLVRREAVVSATSKNAQHYPQSRLFAGHGLQSKQELSARPAALEQLSILMTIPVLLGVNGLSRLAGREGPAVVWVDPTSVKRLDVRA